MGRPRKTAVAAVTETDAFVPTPEEIAALRAIRAKGAQVATPAETTTDGSSKVALNDIAQALITAIEATRPPAKKTPFNRKPGDPWRNKDGSPKTALKRPLFQHAIEVSPDQLFDEQIKLANQLKPGKYCDGWVVVRRRKDGGMDIDYPIKTAGQRLKLANTFGIRNFTDLLQRLIDEKADPAKYRKPEDEDED